MLSFNAALLLLRGKVDQRPLMYACCTRRSSTTDYYSINSVNYDCYLYARYFHGESTLPIITDSVSLPIGHTIDSSLHMKLPGNRGHQTTLDVLYGFATSIIRKLGYAFIPT